VTDDRCISIFIKKDSKALILVVGMKVLSEKCLPNKPIKKLPLAG